MYISEQEAEEHFPNGKAMLQALHPRAKLQLDDTRSGQGRWDSSMSPLLLVLLLISPYARLVQLPNTAKKNPDSQKQMVLYWISGLNQPRVQRAPHDGLWERDSSKPTLLRPLSPSHQHKQPHSLPSLATDPALGAIHSSPWAVFCLDPVLCLNACGRVG